MGEFESPPVRPYQRSLADRFAMATHHGLRCDARGRSCIKLADVEFTLRPVDKEDGSTGAPVTRQSCPRHRAEFLDDPDTWEYVGVRKFARTDAGRLRNPGYTLGSECEDTCTSCQHRRNRSNPNGGTAA